MAPIEQLLIGLGAGIVFGAYGYLTKGFDPDEGYESFSTNKFVRTVAIYGLAGIAVGSVGDPVTQGNIEAATASTVVVGEVVDKLFSRIAKR